MNIEEIYLFTGTEEVRKRAKMDRLLANFDPKTTSIIKYDFDLISVQDVIADAITVPFLAETKVIIGKNPTFLTNQKTPIKHDTKALIKYLKKPVDTCVLIIDAVGIKIDKDNPVYKELQKTAYIIDTQELDDVEYKAWVIRALAKEHVEIKEDALVMLTEFVKHNLVRMEMETSKLIDYVKPGGKVTTADVELLVNPDLETDIYSLVKAIVAKNKPEAIRIFHDMNQNTQDTVGIIALIGRSFQNILSTSKMLQSEFNQSDIAQTLGISNGRAYYLVKEAKTFKLDVLEKYILKLSDLDYKVKTGQIDPNLGLEMLMLETI